MSTWESLSLIAGAVLGEVAQESIDNDFPETLAEMATDPTAPLTQLQLQDWVDVTLYGSDNVANTFIVRPEAAFSPRHYFPFAQILRIQGELETLPRSPHGDNITGLGDFQIYDLILFGTPRWGRWGLGPMGIIPTATNNKLGQGKWQVGPVAALAILNVPRWQFGFLAQNPYSYAGNGSRPDVISLFLQPFIVFHFDHGWYLNTDAQWTFQWNPSKTLIPLNFGFGRVFTIGTQDVNMFLQGEWMAYHNHTVIAPHTTIKLGFHFLFPE